MSTATISARRHACASVNTSAGQPGRAPAAMMLTCRRSQRQIALQQPLHRPRLAPLRAEVGDAEGEAAAAAEAAVAAATVVNNNPPAWELAQRISGDAAAMMMTGDAFASEIILKKGLAEIQERHPGDPSMALLHTQLWNLQTEAGQHKEALEQAQAAYDLMLSYFGEQSADAAFHGIRLGISLIATNGDMDRAQILLMVGGTCAQHNLEVFWNRLQELEVAGSPDAAELGLQTKKLMVALAESNFYGALCVVRKALQTAGELELPMVDLESAWLGGARQMSAAVPPDHPMFATAQRELARLIPDAAGRPGLQDELEDVQTKLQELLYLLRQLPDSMKAEGGAAVVGDEVVAATGSEDFLP